MLLASPPVAHHREARNRSTLASLAVRSIRSTMRSASGLAITFGAYCGSIRIDVGADRLQLREALADQRAAPARADDRAAPNCCRPARARGRASPRSRRRRTAPACRAASSPLTPRLMHGDRHAREKLLELDRKPARIVHRRRAGARAGRRRRADGDDRDGWPAASRCAGARAADGRAAIKIGRRDASELPSRALRRSLRQRERRQPRPQTAAINCTRIGRNRRIALIATALPFGRLPGCAASTIIDASAGRCNRAPAWRCSMSLVAA